MFQSWSQGFRRLWAASVVSRFGDAVDQVAFSWMAYQLTGSAAVLGLLLAFGALPNLVFAPLAGVLADRRAKKPLVVSGYLGRGVVVGLTAGLWALGGLTVPLLFALLFVNSTLETLGAPAASALTAHVVEPERLAEAGGFSTSWLTAVQVGGLGAGGVLVAWGGPGWAILVDALTFGAAGILAAGARIPTDLPRAAGPGNQESWWQEFRQGLGYVASSRPLVTVIGLALFANFAFAPVNVLEVPFVQGVLGGGAPWVAALGMGLAGGMVAGGLAVGPVTGRFGPWPTVFGAFFGLGAGCLLLAGAGALGTGGLGLAAALGCYFLMGVLLPLATAPLGAWLSAQVPRDRQGRVFSTFNALVLAAAPLGAGLTGLAAGALAIPVLFALTGLAVVVATALARTRGT